MLGFELESSGENIIHYIVQIVPINQSMTLVAWVHGNPAQLVTRDIVFHVSPNWLPHHRDRSFVGQ